MNLYEDLPEKSIRLIKVLPDRKKIAINLSKFAFSDEIPAFEALSYASSPEAFTEKIYCTDLADQSENVETSFEVNPHLHEGFQCLRATAEGARPRWLWIDAICLNQNNSKEKSIQAPLMSEIYSRSQGVVVWLGKANEDSDDNVMRIMPELAKKMNDIQDLQSVNYKSARYLHVAKNA